MEVSNFQQCSQLEVHNNYQDLRGRGEDALALGTGCNISIGTSSTVNTGCGVVIGNSSCSTHCNAVVLGSGLISEKTNTVHVDNLISYGQGASKWHSIGSTGGTVSINWDNGNNQSLTLTSSATVTLSNPIAGGNYGLSIEQGGTGGYGITWSGVLWANATPPSLSGAVSAVDFISLVYNGSNYLGTYGNNFA